MATSLSSTLANSSFAAVLSEADQALRGIVNGDCSGYERLFADREDITLGNPFGPFGKGRAEVRGALANAASKYRSGSGSGLEIERVAEYGNEDIVCLVEVERGLIQFAASDVPTAIAARVTTVFERIGLEWKLVHRHADLMAG